MKLTHKSDLFGLIKSLSPSEKRYIKQYINRTDGTNNNYAKLFDAIARQEVEDDKKLKQKFQHLGMIKQWSRNKNYLYNFILRILQVYHQQDAEFEVSNNLQQVTILYKKGLHKDAYKLLKKTKQLAREGVSPTLLPFIAEWEMRLGRLIWYHQEEKEALDYQKNNEQAIDLAENLLIIQKTSADIIGNITQKGRHIRAAPSNLAMLQQGALSSIENAKSPMAQWCFYNTKNVLFTQLKEHNDAFALAKESILLHKKYPLLEKHAPFAYLTSLNGLVTTLLDAEQWEELPFVIQEIDEHLKTNKVTTIQLLLKSIKYMALLKYYIGTNDYEGGLVYAKEILQFLEKNKKENDSYTRPRLLWHYLTIIYVTNGKYEEALGLIEQLEQTQRIAISRNAMLLMKLICLFELEENLQLPYVVRSVYRALLKKKDLFEFERIVLNLLKASANVSSKDALKKVFSKYLIQLHKLVATAAKPELELLEHFNFLAWMESKVENRPLLDILREGSNVSIK